MFESFVSRWSPLAIALGLLSVTADGIGATGAEYAMRWAPSQGGPQNADAALDRLGLDAGERKDFRVRYFDPPRPSGLPASATVVLRERVEGVRIDTTWKVRVPVAEVRGRAGWPCALKSPDRIREEIDVTVLDHGAVRRSIARTCEMSATFEEALPGFARTPVGCASRMQRVESRDGSIVVEHWQVGDGSAMLEVSSRGKDDAQALAGFQNRVAKKLVRAGVRPLDRSRSEIGTQCTPPSAAAPVPAVAPGPRRPG